MKQTKFFLTCVLATSFALGFTACSDDDDDNPGMPKVKMGITSMYGGYTTGWDLPGQSAHFEDVVYDSNGRVVSYTDKCTYGDDDYPKHITYEYGKDKIIVKSGSYIYEEYTLNGDGLIVSSDDAKYTYNDQKQLISISMQYRSYNYKWEGGNPVSCKYDDDTFSIGYTSQANTLSCFQHHTYSVVYFDECDPFLMAAGYFGQQPKNLVSRIGDESNYHNFTYSDFNENGYPCKMQIEDEDYYVQEYTFTWTKL